MQTGARSVVHQHPVRITRELQPGHHRIGALFAALGDGHPRILSDGQPFELTIFRADRHDHPFNARVAQQGMDSVFDDAVPADG
ncbi:Uncharacterised protein [Acinetobacter baumannii]|nr:Uncharacterised protein [Acinetobacter baumannii]